MKFLIKQAWTSIQRSASLSVRVDEHREQDNIQAKFTLRKDLISSEQLVHV